MHWDSARRMFPEIPAVELSRIEGYLAGTDSTADSFVGEIDATGHFLFAYRQMNLGSESVFYAVYLVGHRGHFVKVQATDLTKGKSVAQIATFLTHLLVQMHAN
jgi:hypothetical protein